MKEKLRLKKTPLHTPKYQVVITKNEPVYQGESLPDAKRAFRECIADNKWLSDHIWWRATLLIDGVWNERHTNDPRLRRQKKRSRRQKT